MAHVDLTVHLHDCESRSRTCREALPPRVCFAPGGIVDPVRREKAEQRSVLAPTAPILLEVPRTLSPDLVGHAVRVVLRRRNARICAVEYECRHPLRVRRCEKDRKGSAFRTAVYRCTLRTCGIHHGTEIIHPFLKRCHGDAVRQAGAALVEHDQAAKRCETLEVATLGGIFPLQFQIRDEWRDVNEVEGTLAHDLIGDVHVARLRVPGLGDLDHAVSLGRLPRRASRLRPGDASGRRTRP